MEIHQAFHHFPVTKAISLSLRAKCFKISDIEPPRSIPWQSIMFVSTSMLQCIGLCLRGCISQHCISPWMSQPHPKKTLVLLWQLQWSHPIYGELYTQHQMNPCLRKLAAHTVLWDQCGNLIWHHYLLFQHCSKYQKPIDSAATADVCSSKLATTNSLSLSSSLANVPSIPVVDAICVFNNWMGM